MVYSTKTRSNTPPGRYHIHQTISNWKNRQITNRRQETEDRRQNANHAMPWAPPKRPLMQFKAAMRDLLLNSVVDCAVGFNSLDFQSTAPPKMTHSPVRLWAVARWITISKILLQAAGVSLIPVRSLSDPMMGCAVSIEIGDASLWRCWLPLDIRSGRSSFPF
jgi:hypothetical protein